MTPKSLVLPVLFLMVLQAIVIIVVTKLNGKHFDGRRASEYNAAINDLSKDKPRAALVIKFCYAAFVVESLGLIILKFIWK